MSEYSPFMEGGPSLIFYDDLRLLRSIDPHICSVNLRPKTNNPTDGFELAISVFFGSEKIRIKIADEEFDFLFQIHKAEVVLDRVACTFDPTYERPPVAIGGGAGSENKANIAKSQTSIKASSGKGLENLGFPTFSIEHGRTSPSVPKPARKLNYKVEIIRDDVLRVEVTGDKSLPLEGVIIDEYLGWRVLPNSGMKSGVIARVRVREDWISLIEPQQVRKKGKYWKYISDIFSSDGEVNNFRKDAFSVLLNYLVAKGLQDESNTLDATISVDGVVLGPSAEKIEKLNGRSEARGLAVNDHPLARFLTSERGRERQILLDAGVSPSRIPLDPAEQYDQGDMPVRAGVHAKERRNRILLRVLIAQNEEALGMLLRYNFEAEGFEVALITDADELMHQAREDPPDVIVLDAVFGGRGFELCRQLRTQSATRAIPVLILTDRGDETDRILGFEAGADDYIVKPFSTPEFLARVRAVLRRVAPKKITDKLKVGNITLDRISGEVKRGTRDITLKPTELRILEFLMLHPGKLLSREKLLDGVWGIDKIVEEQRVNSHINNLRRALSNSCENDPIKTVRGAGYLLIGDIND